MNIYPITINNRCNNVQDTLAFKSSSEQTTIRPSLYVTDEIRENSVATTADMLINKGINIDSKPIDYCKKTQNDKVQNKDYATPEEFAKYGINVRKIHEDGLYTIDELEPWHRNFYYGTKVLDKDKCSFIEKHFHQIKEIDESANFEHLNIQTLCNLQKIGGNAHFENSKVINLYKLNEIGGDVDFSNSKIKRLGNLSKIGGDVNLSKIKSLGHLQEIGGNAHFEHSEMQTLGNLQRIGGNVHFENSKIVNLGDLQDIGGSVNFFNTKIRSLGKLKSIGGDAYFKGSNINDLGNLETIGGDAYFCDSKIEDFAKLKKVDGDIYCNSSQKKKFNFIHNYCTVHIIKDQVKDYDPYRSAFGTILDY